MTGRGVLFCCLSLSSLQVIFLIGNKSDLEGQVYTYVVYQARPSLTFQKSGVRDGLA